MKKSTRTYSEIVAAQEMKKENQQQQQQRNPTRRGTLKG